MRSPRRLALAGATAALLVAPAAAHAATKTVYMGPQQSDEKTLNKTSLDVDDFFPHSITIRAGDSIRFDPTQFHSVDLIKKGGKKAPLFQPTGKTISGDNDPAGTAYWFNGKPEIGFNPAQLKGNFGKKLTYTGAKQVISGIPVQNKPKPMTVKFTKAGTYTYFCDIHPGMKGVVKVVAPGRPVPSAAADKKAYKAQIARVIKAGKKLQATKPAAGTVDVGASGPGGVEYFGFFPHSIDVPAGTTLKFQMFSGSREVHTATIGPGDPEKDPGSFLGTLANSFNQPVFDQAAVYPSDPPGTTPSLTPSSHGNGFWGSGVLSSAGNTPGGRSSSVTLSQPGTYNVYCMIHPFMHAVVTVR